MSRLEATAMPVGRVIRRFGAAEGALLIAVVSIAIGLGLIAALPLWQASIAVTLLSGTVIWRFYQGRTGHRFGLANWVTLFRLNLVVLMLLAVWPGEPMAPSRWLLFVIAATALALDGVDGWLARRRQETSPFGERFDMAADMALTIALGVCLVALGLVGPWVLLIGLMRPAFALAGRLWPRFAAPLPPRLSRKVTCATALCCLVAALAPPLAAAAPVLALAALGQLVWSFAHDLRYLWQPPAAL